LGTPFEMYDDKGGRVWQGELDSFGAIRDFKGNSLTDCPFRYQGQYEDSETGLYYNRFRYYSPEEGMYISQDPIRLDGGVALYGYVNDLNVYIDPLGLKCKKTSYEAGSRREAIREAKRDAGIPNNQQPSRVFKEDLLDGDGKRMFDKNNKLIETRNYEYTRPGKEPITIQEHSRGHVKAEKGHGVEPHFNVRPNSNTKTGSVKGTHGHYNF
jgi:RHS repeat-associated protein